MKLTITIVLLITHSFAVAVPDSVNSDSVIKPKEKAAHWRLTTRFHSKGAFYYSGRIISDNPVNDVNFVYDRKKWGFLFFKATDLVDHRTDINFTFAVLYKNFKLGKRVMITPNAGFFMDQKHSLADKGSDAVVIVNSAIKLSPHFTFDNAAIFGSLLLTHEYNWTNRFRLLYSERHVDATAFLWHNNKLFDGTGYLSTGVNLSYSRMKLSDHLSLTAGITALTMLQSNDLEEFPMKKGILFTVGAQFNN